MNKAAPPRAAQVIVKTVYGRNLLYPANDVAMALADIAGTTTLDPRVLRTARDRLGLPVLTLEQDALKVSAMLK